MNHDDDFIEEEDDEMEDGEYEDFEIPIDEPGGEIDEEGNVVMSSEEDLMRRAILEFQNNFTRYVKEMDPELWRKAIEYAKDFTQIEGVTFTEDFEFSYGDEEDDQEEE